MDQTSNVDLEVLDRIQQAVGQRGVQIHADGESVTLEVDGHTLRRPVRWLTEDPSARSPRALRTGARDQFFLASRIGPSLARRIRDDGGWYADAAGNMFVRAPGVLIEVEGRLPASSRKPAPARRNARNLVSPGRAQVVFSLLTWPHLVTRSMKEVAEVAGVSSSLVHTVFLLLEQERYLSVTSRGLERRDELIDLWAAAYPLGLARWTELGRFSGEPRPRAWSELGHQVYTSGEYAAENISGPDLVLYVPELEPRALMSARWKRPAPQEHANIIVRKAFWADPDAITLEPRVERAPQLLVYGDLLASNDPRQREAAAAMRGEL
ncbi:hypothetical protein H9623_02455 [Oerskovia sp. Sa1BUA8]|uniref:HTH iclR-type domain-containing protein n=1 Tax=Oerskovia douganii TaxID=2762210 RepID=A0A9D5U606_9CELL|nr:type IV toxin-antitoxin system AbiEi family antitoxin [Oerskovia douganii]MBE7699168.1 hypothetical protein [Oerskovia douganii]